MWDSPRSQLTGRDERFVRAFLRTLGVLAEGVAALGLAVMFWGCSRAEAPQRRSAEKVAQELFDFSTRHVKDNVVQWTLKAESAVFLEPERAPSGQQTGRVEVHRPEVLIYEKGKPAVRITAEEGTIYQDTYDLKFTGKVVAVHGDATVYTEEMYWLNEQSEIYVPGGVKIVRGDSVLTGHALSADPNLKRARLSKPKFTLYPKDENTYVPLQP